MSEDQQDGVDEVSAKDRQRELHQEDAEKYSDVSSSSDEDVVDFAQGELPSEIMDRMEGLLGKKGKMEKPKVLEELSLAGIVEYVKAGKAKNVVTMAGAGISTSAGIPDFRTPGTGLYDNLKKYNLPYPEAVFSIDYFRDNPEPFFKLGSYENKVDGCD